MINGYHIITIRVPEFDSGDPPTTTPTQNHDLIVSKPWYLSRLRIDLRNDREKVMNLIKMMRMVKTSTRTTRKEKTLGIRKSDFVTHSHTRWRKKFLKRREKWEW
jgi:hypothetical protein